MIQLKNVTYSYNHQPLIQDMDVTFEKGKVTAIIGPNGCGKSTLLKLACRLLRPQKGNVFLEDQEIGTFKGRTFARKVSVLLQNNPIPDMTVERAVLSGRYPYQSPFKTYGQEDRTITEYAMKVTGCHSLRYKNMHQLSGGERQRAFLAMRLAQDTPVIFLDEPTTYLDINVSYEMMELLREQNQKLGKTIVMVLHDMTLALNYADYIILMENGKIKACNSVLDDELHHCIGEIFHVKIQSFSETDRSQFYFVKR
ncbi:ABC transporter ATP-binding protein [Lacrimispora sp. JR3]|uniref:ABC transporter ATP-binding protein n=1 Tax=Lacrimispora sinapis TaxID=3111456 RepID=UPI00374A0F73